MIDEGILPLSEIQAKLADKRLTGVAERCGLSYPTVKKIKDGDDTTTIRTLRNLCEYLRGE